MSMGNKAIKDALIVSENSGFTIIIILYQILELFIFNQVFGMAIRSISGYLELSFLNYFEFKQSLFSMLFVSFRVIYCDFFLLNGRFYGYIWLLKTFLLTQHVKRHIKVSLD